MKCVFCGVEIAALAQHVCAKCGAPQPIAPQTNYFSLLGVVKGFRQDLETLEKRFYEISRTLHPDRFAAGSDKKWKTISVDRMSAVNKAYQTLSKKESLRDYLLELEGVSPSAKTEEKAATRIPAELAEEWFDLQDAVMEEPENAIAKLDDFGKALRVRADDLKKRIESLENEYDGFQGDRVAGAEEAGREILGRIQKLSLDGQYLKSMSRDLLRLQSRLGI